jgi:hypothetical protein
MHGARPVLAALEPPLLAGFPLTTTMIADYILTPNP